MSVGCFLFSHTSSLSQVSLFRFCCAKTALWAFSQETYIQIMTNPIIHYNNTQSRFIAHLIILFSFGFMLLLLIFWFISIIFYDQSCTIDVFSHSFSMIYRMCFLQNAYKICENSEIHTNITCTRLCFFPSITYPIRVVRVFLPHNLGKQNMIVLHWPCQPFTQPEAEETLKLSSF